MYDEIEAKDYEDILLLYNKMRLSKDRVQAVVNDDTRRELIGLAALAINIVLGAVIAVGTSSLSALRSQKE